MPQRVPVGTQRTSLSAMAIRMSASSGAFPGWIACREAEVAGRVRTAAEGVGSAHGGLRGGLCGRVARRERQRRPVCAVRRGARRVGGDERHADRCRALGTGMGGLGGCCSQQAERRQAPEQPTPGFLPWYRRVLFRQASRDEDAGPREDRVVRGGVTVAVGTAIVDLHSVERPNAAFPILYRARDERVQSGAQVASRAGGSRSALHTRPGEWHAKLRRWHLSIVKSWTVAVSVPPPGAVAFQ